MHGSQLTRPHSTKRKLPAVGDGSVCFVLNSSLKLPFCRIMAIISGFDHPSCFTFRKKKTKKKKRIPVWCQSLPLRKVKREAGFKLFWPGLLLQGCCLFIRGSSREGRKEVERRGGNDQRPRSRHGHPCCLVVLVSGEEDDDEGVISNAALRRRFHVTVCSSLSLPPRIRRRQAGDSGLGKKLKIHKALSGDEVKCCQSI